MALSPLLPAGAGVAAVQAGERKRHLVVIPKASDQLFWDLVRSGVEQAVAEAGRAGRDVGLTWRGPAYSGDALAQIRILQSYIRPDVDAIVLAANDRTRLLEPVQAAVAAGIPVIILDSALDGDAHSALVATDNLAAGRQAAREMARRLGGKGDVLVLRTLAGSASTFDRGRGFVEELGRIAPTVRVVADVFGGGAPGDLRARAGELLRNHPDVDGIFSVNESSTDGMLRALRSVARPRRHIFIGFDATPFLLDAVGSGEIDALVIQDPRHMGLLGARLAISLMSDVRPAPASAPLPPGMANKKFTIETRLVTRENMAQPDIRQLMCLTC
ncbi:substrate-binding domain-containing protein [Sphaerotilus mobilis]|uniref:substrate-binding domain-containing protein n=1 Tax=Sphaerotilus mobilis TaxID=47994 RepID=UPI0013EE7CE6|nr:substrate-binding domain-containing protein [Sphaerotilus mobilis]